MGNTAINSAHMCSSAPSRGCVKSLILTVLQVKYFCVKWQISQRGETILEGKIPLITLTHHNSLMCACLLPITKK